MKTEIEKFNPSKEAIEFRRQYNSFREAWNNCPRGDWMLWIAQKLNVDFKSLTRARAKCALTVRHLMKDKRSINACEVALKFADGLATKNELDTAYTNAEAAAADAFPAEEAYAADAAAACNDYAAAVAASAAASAAYTYAAANHIDAAAASAVARKKSLLETANICREVLTDSVLAKIKEQ